jgi:hypothetical protein
MRRKQGGVEDAESLTTSHRQILGGGGGRKGEGASR